MGEYESRWVCGNCGRGGRLPLNTLDFAPDVCPACGSGDTSHRQIARERFRPSRRHPVRIELVDRQGEVVGWSAVGPKGET